ncbi:MAG TPA: DUF72 domain-containing protein [Puia sp.]|nr:DUF72 domain-containing protein [Puia sp.]
MNAASLNDSNMNATNTPQLWAGTSGLVLPVPNKQAFPPAFRDAPRLTYYASLFNSIEINSTFYKIPKPATFARWVTEVPDNFQFTVKLWRGITHTAQLQFDPNDLDRFLHAAQHLDDKIGCLLIQFPPSLQAAAAPQLAELLAAIRRSEPDRSDPHRPNPQSDLHQGTPQSGSYQSTPHRSWKLAVEFRHRSWYNPEINAILSRYHATRVLHDMPASAIEELPADHPTIPFIYLRFHGPAGDYKGGYPATILAAWADRINLWLSEEKAVYVYFNNTIGDALVDLARLRALLPVL